jgi:hypothetical protein
MPKAARTALPSAFEFFETVSSENLLNKQLVLRNAIAISPAAFGSEKKLKSCANSANYARDLPNRRDDGFANHVASLFDVVHGVVYHFVCADDLQSQTINRIG